MIIVNKTANPLAICLKAGTLRLSPGLFSTPTPEQEGEISERLKEPFFQALIDEGKLVFGKKKIPKDAPLDLVSLPGAPENLKKPPRKNGKEASVTIEADGIGSL